MQIIGKKVFLKVTKGPQNYIFWRKTSKDLIFKISWMSFFIISPIYFLTASQPKILFFFSWKYQYRYFNKSFLIKLHRHYWIILTVLFYFLFDFETISKEFYYRTTHSVFLDEAKKKQICLIHKLIFSQKNIYVNTKGKWFCDGHSTILIK